MSSAMKATTRESEIWIRSATKHTRDSEPVAAAFSQHLAHMAQETRDEFEEIQKAAYAMHIAALEAK